MSNVFTSSIGKKLIMSISGLFLMLFLLVHLTANLFILAGDEAFTQVCHFMSYMVPIVPILALGVIVHIIYALILTIKNRKARPQRYLVNNQCGNSEWSSRNMFVLGVVIAGILGLHLVDFWAKMQLQEFMGVDVDTIPYFEIVVHKFTNPLFVIIYSIWFVALWFHLMHGFWSSLQTVGFNNKIWLNRWKWIGRIYATIVCGGFLIIPWFVLMKYGWGWF